MTEETAATGTEGRAPAADSGATDAGTQGTGTETPAGNADETTGLEADKTGSDQQSLFEPKTESDLKAEEEKAKEAEAEKSKEENTDDSLDKEKESESEDTAPTAEELGYDNIREDQKVIVELAVESGITRKTLLDAVVDGQLDISKLGDIPAREAAILKTTVDAEYVKLKNERDTRRTELHNHVGSKENFEAMVEWANKESNTNAEFKAEVGEYVRMMKEGGTQGKLAVQAMFEKFKASPNSSMPLKGGETADNRSTQTKELTKREKLDQGWENFAKKNRQ